MSFSSSAFSVIANALYSVDRDDLKVTKRHVAPLDAFIETGDDSEELRFLAMDVAMVLRTLEDQNNNGEILSEEEARDLYAHFPTQDVDEVITMDTSDRESSGVLKRKTGEEGEDHDDAKKRRTEDNEDISHSNGTKYTFES